MSGGGGQSTTTVQELSDEQKELLSLVLPAATDITENPPTQFPGSTIAGFDPLQVQAQDNAVRTAVGGVQPLVDQTIASHKDLQKTALPGGVEGLNTLIGGADAAKGAQDFFLSGAALDPGSNPALQKSASSAVGALSDSLLEDVLPGIRRGAQTAGQVGSSRQGIAEGQAIGDFQQQAGQITSDMFSKAFDTGLNTTQKALGDTLGVAGDSSKALLGEGVRSLFAAPELSELALLPSNVLSAVGGQRQALDQKRLSEEANRFMTDQLMPFLVAQDVADIAFGAPGGSTRANTSGGGGGVGDILGGLIPLLAAFI